MPKYTVEIKEVHHNIVEVEAPEGASFTTVADLAETALDEADECHIEYSHRLDRSDWIVRDGEKNFLVPD